jgi:hypothetical protein
LLGIDENTEAEFKVEMGRKQSNPIYRPEFFVRDRTDRNLYICQCLRLVKERIDSDEENDQDNSTQNFVEKPCLEKMQVFL